MDYSLLFLNIPISTALPMLEKESASFHHDNRYIWMGEIKPQELLKLSEEVRLHYQIPRTSNYALTYYDDDDKEVTINLKKSKNIQKTVIVSSDDLDDVDGKISIKAMISIGLCPFEETFTFPKRGKIMVFDFTQADEPDAMMDFLR